MEETHFKFQYLAGWQKVMLVYKGTNLGQLKLSGYMMKKDQVYLYCCFLHSALFALGVISGDLFFGEVPITYFLFCRYCTLKEFNKIKRTTCQIQMIRQSVFLCLVACLQ